MSYKRSVIEMKSHVRSLRMTDFLYGEVKEDFSNVQGQLCENFK